MVATPFAFRTFSAASARPSEYGSWKSKRTTFFTYFAHDSCSVPRKPAPPVIGETKPTLNGALQLILADFVDEAVFSGRADAAATTASASAAAANGRMNLSLRMQSLLAVGERG